MTAKLLDKLTDETISGLKGFFAHQINNGEDPTTCIQKFLDFLESNKEKSPQFCKKIASRIDCDFFASLKKSNRIDSPDDFITTYHNLVNKLIEINPQTPFKADYERQKTLIGHEKNLIKERLRKEKEDKKKMVVDEYSKLLSERRKDYKRHGSGSNLRIAFVVCFILFVVLLLADMVFHVPESESAAVPCMMVFGFAGAYVGSVVIGGLVKYKFGRDWGYFLGWVPGAWAGLSLASAFLLASPYAIFPWLDVGIVLAIIYNSKAAAVHLTEEEQAAYNTSSDNIEKHFSDKGKKEITQSVVKILTTDS